MKQSRIIFQEIHEWTSVLFSILSIIILGMILGHKANATSQYLGEQLKNVHPSLQNAPKDARPSPFFPTTENKSPYEDSHQNESSVYLPNEKQAKPLPRVEPRAYLKSADGHIPGSGDAQGQYYQQDKLELLQKSNISMNSELGFSFFKDTYSYKNGSSNFDRIFRKSDKSHFPGMIRITYLKFLTESYGHLGIGLDGGIGFNDGRSSFANGEKSESKMILWTFPIDGLVVYQMTIIPRYLFFTPFGGPSVLILSQSRSDIKSGKKKNMQQYSFGYSYGAKLGLNLSPLLKEADFSTFNPNEVANYILNFYVRGEHYSNFKSKDISISGLSFGIGLSYQFF